MKQIYPRSVGEVVKELKGRKEGEAERGNRRWEDDKI